MKAQVYPEYVCILHAAKTLGRPVKWTDERSGSFVSDNHGRDHEQTAELALDAEGNFLAIRLAGYGNLGGFQGAMSPQPPTLNIVRNVISLYQTPLMEVSTKCVFTNTSFVSPYRGAGRPEGNYFMERLIDYAAARDRHRPHRAARARTRSAPSRSRTRPPPARPTTAATSRRSSRRRSKSPTGRASTSASARARSAASCAASASAAISKSPRRPTRRWAASASRPTAASPSSPARSTTARATPRRSRRC